MLWPPGRLLPAAGTPLERLAAGLRRLTCGHRRNNNRVVVSLKARQREDTAIGSALWAVGMAIGIVFISMTPGYNEELVT